MAVIKTLQNDDSVEEFIRSLSGVKQTDGFVLLELYKKITGLSPKMWGTGLIGFGQYHYKSERSKQEGDWPLIAFSPRKQNLSLYFMDGFDDYREDLAKLGKHKTGMGCLYINKLTDVDTKILETMIAKSFVSMKEKYS